MTSFDASLHAFLQLAVVLTTCRVVGWLGRRFLGQTQVVMEMVAGVLLGPSLLGLVAPGVQAWLFPRQLEVATAQGPALITHPNMTILYALAQVGLVLYMFIIGLELDLGLLRGRGRAAALVSAAGIALPFAGATALVPYLLARGDSFIGQPSWGVAWLFVGASISITAFPMLARILHERGISSTTLGTLTLAAGAIDDAVAWCLLAVVLAVFSAQPEAAWLTVAGGLAYGVFMLGVGRRALAWLGRRVEARGALDMDVLGGVLALLSLCAFATDWIGIYAVFGAFVCGAAMPRGLFARLMTDKVEQLTAGLFLPMFFVYSGLNTRITLLDSWELWAVAGLVTAVSVLCKGVGCTLVARATGEGWRRSALVGVLMNARGLMELILLNIGLERGLITPTFFTVMVLMAVVTTGMASPLYGWLSRGVDLGSARPAPRAEPAQPESAPALGAL